MWTRPLLAFCILIPICVAVPASAQTGSTSGSIDTPASASAATAKKDANGTAEPAESGRKPVLSETVVVTATRSQRVVSELPVSTTVLREEDVRATPANTIDDLLRGIAGVNIPLSSSMTNFTQKVSMHGLGETSALVLLDGLPIQDPFFGAVELQRIPLDTIHQVEIVRGGTASLFGNTALGGTINLVTRPVDSSELRMSGSYGSNSTGRGAITVDQMLTQRLGIRVAHHQMNTDGVYRSVVLGPIDRRAWADSSISNFRADYRPSDGTSAYLKGAWSDISTSQGTPIGQFRRMVGDIATGVQHATGRSGLLAVNLFHQHENVYQISTSVPASRASETLSAKSKTPENATGASLEWSTQRAGSLSFLSAGLDARDTGAQQVQASFSSPVNISQVDRLEGHQRFAGVFGQASWHPQSRLEVLASARLDYYTNSSGSDTILYGPATPVARYPDTTTRQFDPRVSFRYAMQSDAAVRGAVYRAFRAPTLRDLYATSVTGRSVLIPNPYLQPQTMVGGEIGIEKALRRAHFEMNLFRSDVSGLQVRVPVPGKPSNYAYNINAGKSRSQGIEAMSGIQLSSRFSVDATYTYTDSTIIDNPADRTIEGKMVPDVPRHAGALTLRYRGPDGTTVDVRGRAQGRSYGEATNVGISPANHLLDIGVSRPVRSWIDAYASLENALDKHYYYSLTAVSTKPGSPRAFTAGFRLRVPTSRGRFGE